jgi:uncharacterized membrane protein YphA (DoxX/SURF4 family)
MGLFRFLARSAFAEIFILRGFDTVTNPGGRPDIVARTLPVPAPQLMVRLNGAGMLTGGVALALGIKPRLAAFGLAAILVPTTYAGHQFWNEEDTGTRRNQRIHFDKNLSLIGGLLTYALGA